jgi:galactokinase
MTKKEIIPIFQEKFGQNNPEVYTSPGRINLIGEHTDYNGSFVFPGAIDKGMIAAIHFNHTDKVRAYAIDLDESSEFGLNEEDLPKEGWAKYLFGVCREIIKRGGSVKGFDTVFSGDVPLGAGMSSSAALESTYAYALNDLLGLGIDKFELARIGQSTEHNYVGVNCGIMDQFASLFGKKGHLIRLDTKSMEYAYFPFDPKGYKLVLLDTVVKHELASSAYNKRRESCEQAARTIAKRHPDYETVGQKMYETHHGMSKLYEVSCGELDFLNDVARAHGVTGSRVMGGGFGGCTINLVKDELYDSFVSDAKAEFKSKYGHEPKVYDVVISDGARKL